MWFVVRKVYYLLAVIKSAKTVFFVETFQWRIQVWSLQHLGQTGWWWWWVLKDANRSSSQKSVSPPPPLTKKKYSSWPYFLSDLNPNKKHSINNIILFLKNEWNMSECRAMSVRFSYYLLHARLKHRNMDCV